MKHPADGGEHIVVGSVSVLVIYALPLGKLGNLTVWQRTYCSPQNNFGKVHRELPRTATPNIVGGRFFCYQVHLQDVQGEAHVLF